MKEALRKDTLARKRIVDSDHAESRRSFLKKSAGMAAVSLIGSSTTWAGANERIRIGICGIRGQGRTHIGVREVEGTFRIVEWGGYSSIENTQVATICDVDERELAKRVTEMGKAGVPAPRLETDIRRLLEDDSIDVISIATPNHWHSLMGIWACQAGKDVYIEKPLSHNMAEGKKLVEAARKYKCIVQHGSQSRSAAAMREGVQRMREGLIGELYMAKGMCYKWRDTIGHTHDEPVPEGVHYDRWIGPAPERPFSRNRFHYNWHWQWPYGNGDIGNQGMHQLDVARWGLGVVYPRKIQAMGGHYMFADDQTTPNTMLSTFEYPDEDKMLVFEVRHWITNHEGGLGGGASNNIGNIFYGSKGYMVFSTAGYETYLGQNREPGPSNVGGGATHFQNFIDCVRSRNSDALHAEVEEGHRSCTLLHLANAAYRAGRTIEFDPEKEAVIGDAEAQSYVDGSWRGYRKPYELPRRV